MDLYFQSFKVLKYHKNITYKNHFLTVIHLKFHMCGLVGAVCSVVIEIRIVVSCESMCNSVKKFLVIEIFKLCSTLT